MNDMNSVMAAYAKHAKALEQANLINKTAVFEALSVAGITSVSVEFDGEGDSGQIESVIASIGEDRRELPRTAVTFHKPSWQGALIPAETPLSEAIENLCYAFLSQEHGGWQDNEGAFGSFEFNVKRRSIQLEFNGRYTEVSTINHKF